ncbi:MAG: ABC transporter ATP-binding protein [Nitriliruptorales bacterium]
MIAKTTTAAPTRSTRDDRAEPVLEVRGLTKVFEKGERSVGAVDDVDLTVHAGEVLGLLGPNAAGKTTTIKMSAGLLTPTAGEVRIAGDDLLRNRGAAVRHLGAVLEGGRNVYWSLSAWQNLLYFGRLRGFRRREIEPRAEWLLRELGLWDRRHELVGSFSRGMQQKVAVAAALVTDPLLLLLDEPTIGLDVAAARTVKSWIRRLATDEGRAVVLTTHQLDVAQELSDRVAVIREGCIVADLPVDDLLRQFQEDRYQIRVGTPVSALDGVLSPEVDVAAEDGETTTLVVADGDLKALYDLLLALALHRLPLVSVTPVQPDLEDIFIRLVDSER